MSDSNAEGRVLVWDLPTRLFHWALAASFLGAYVLSENDGLRAFHVMFGYTVLGLVIFRLLWGFLGSTHSRFSSFAYGPRAAWGYLRDLARGRAADFTGHNPAGSWAIYLLLALAAATGVSGWLQYQGFGGEAMEEAHEVLANAWLVVVLLHIAGVVVGSLAHRRNLVGPMLTGYRQGATAATGSSRVAVGVFVALSVVAFWSASLAGFGPASPDAVSRVLGAGQQDGPGDHEHGHGYDEDDD